MFIAFQFMIFHVRSFSIIMISSCFEISQVAKHDGNHRRVCYSTRNKSTERRHPFSYVKGIPLGLFWDIYSNHFAGTLQTTYGLFVEVILLFRNSKVFDFFSIDDDINVFSCFNAKK